MAHKYNTLDKVIKEVGPRGDTNQDVVAFIFNNKENIPDDLVVEILTYYLIDEKDYRKRLKELLRISNIKLGTLAKKNQVIEEEKFTDLKGPIIVNHIEEIGDAENGPELSTDFIGEYNSIEKAREDLVKKGDELNHYGLPMGYVPIEKKEKEPQEYPNIKKERYEQAAEEIKSYFNQSLYLPEELTIEVKKPEYSRDYKIFLTRKVSPLSMTFLGDLIQICNKLKLLFIVLDSETVQIF